MLENFIYENHQGRRFVGLSRGVYINTNELRDYSWSYDVINNRISRFYRSPRERKLPLVICCATTAEAAAVKNELMDFTETDIEAMRPGKIYVGDYYTTGYITDSKKSDYRIHGRHCKVDLVLTSADPSWAAEQVHVFGGSAGGLNVVSGFDFPFDYDYDYSVSTTNRQIVCDSVRPNKFRLRIYGEATDPAIMINDHTYKVNGMVKAGETLLVDSLNKTITLTTAAGREVNWFNNRDRAEYIFEPIPAGMNDILYGGDFAFDLTVIEERSEPRWT